MLLIFRCAICSTYICTVKIKACMTHMSCAYGDTYGVHYTLTCTMCMALASIFFTKDQHCFSLTPRDASLPYCMCWGRLHLMHACTMHGEVALVSYIHCVVHMYTVELHTLCLWSCRHSSSLQVFDIQRAPFRYDFFFQGQPTNSMGSEHLKTTRSCMDTPMNMYS